MYVLFAGTHITDQCIYLKDVHYTRNQPQTNTTPEYLQSIPSNKTWYHLKFIYKNEFNISICLEYSVI